MGEISIINQSNIFQFMNNALGYATERFVDTVQRFCRWAESTPGNIAQEQTTAHELLSELYFLALSLPKAKDFSYPDFPALTHDDWMKMHKRFGSLPFQYYNDFFDPLNLKKNEPGMGNICDDMADIYRDLKNGLTLYESIGETAGFSYWQSHFSIHWGRHLTGAMNALEYYRSTSYLNAL